MPYKDPEKRRESWRRWARNHRDDQVRKKRDAVRAIARYYLDEKQPCSIKECKNIGERHHPDYSKPLQVLWLCKLHHDLIHKPQIRFCSIKNCKRIHKAKGLCNAHYMSRYYPKSSNPSKNLLLT